MRKVFNLSVFLFAVLAPFFSAGQEQQRKGNLTFGEHFLNLRFYHYEVGKEDPKARHHTSPKEAALWQFHHKKDSDRNIRLEGSFGGQMYLKMKINEALPEVIVFSPSGSFEFTLPSLSKIKGDDKKEFIERGELRAFPPSYDELFAYRNMALNPLDFQDAKNDKPEFFPHATASSECRGDLTFRARNAIDGAWGEKGHGSWKNRAWGPEQVDKPELLIDFGREVEIDKVVLRLRDDFPHDDAWTSGVLEFSDKSKFPVKIKKSAEAQEFTFPKKKSAFVKLAQLSAPSPIGWCALSELEAWGRELMPFQAYDKNGKKLPFYLAISTLQNGNINEAKNLWLWRMLEEMYPVEASWLRVDFGFDLAKFPTDDAGRIELFNELASKIASGLNDKSGAAKFIASAKNSKTVQAAAQNYFYAAGKRRIEFFANLKGKPNTFIYVERYPISPSFFGYTEAVSDARGEARFAPNSALCMLTINPNGTCVREVLLEDKNGAIRDPDVSYDGKKILFSWKKSAYEDDFHIYEMELASRKIRQITEGVHADIEAKYLPTGEIIFNSTRCEQTTDCWLTEVSNLYMMKPDGKFLRRVGFDQVCTPYPTVTEQGDIVYTRWDYNDRGQTFTQPLFLMKPDASFQTELYGNKSWYPTTTTHARQIPKTNKFLAILCGHHTAQRGKLAEIDPSKGRQENVGVELLAPRRKEDAVRIDAYGQRGEQFSYPFPLSQDLFLVSFQPTSTDNRVYPSAYGLYLMTPDGERELLVSHPYLDSVQAVALAPRELPKLEKSRIDYSKDKGYLFVRNIYYGDGVEGVKKGSIKKLRVIKIDYRRAPVGSLDGYNNEGGVGVGNMVCTPIGLGQGAWDTKEILGEVDVAPDGSVYFEVPARTPVYFQPIDENGYAVTTMRSWTAMQPNEFYSCLGCHGDRDSPHKQALNLAPDRKPEKLKQFYDVEGGFSFRKTIQPILDKNCISCHNDRSVARIVSSDGKSKISVESLSPTSGEKWLKLEENSKNISTRAFSLLDFPQVNKKAKREFNDAYYNLLQPRLDNGQAVCFADFTNPLINWNGMQSVPTLLPPYFRGSAKSEFMSMLKNGHGKTKLSKEELDKLAAWIDLYVPYCGDYYEANTWNEGDKKFYKYYEDKAQRNIDAEAKAIQEYLKSLKK